jgi:hypothetical protein
MKETGRRLAELRRSNAATKHRDRRLKRLNDRPAIRRAWKKDQND